MLNPYLSKNKLSDQPYHSAIAPAPWRTRQEAIAWCQLPRLERKRERQKVSIMNSEREKEIKCVGGKEK